MKIISFLNSKGGVGKTTLATNLAMFFQHIHCKRVLLVDADPQGSVRDWQEAGDQRLIEVIAADRKSTLSNVRSLINNNNYDFVIIDTPGKIGDMVATAISMSDVCLIPVCPSPYDIWASNEIVDMIEVRQQLTSGFPHAYYVLNLCDPTANISRDVEEHLMTEGRMKVLGLPIKRRVAFKDSAKRGKTVYGWSDLQAKSEMNALGTALMTGAVYEL